MTSKFIFFFLLLGLSSIISQAVVLRELMVSFYGNEFFVGLVLACWLIWTATGSLLAKKFFLKIKNYFSLFFVLQILFSFFLFLEIFLIRYFKGEFLGLEIPHLFHSFLAALFVPLPLAFVLGSWWTIGVKIFSDKQKALNISSINLGYWLECLGFVLGGLLFSFLLVKFDSFWAINFLIVWQWATFIYLLPQKGWRFLKIFSLLLCLVSFSFFFTPFLKKLEAVSNNLEFKNQTLIHSQNTPYSKIQITQLDSQYNFYQNGIYLGSEKDFAFAEKFAHFPLIAHPQPEKILLIGGGLNGVLREILKQPVKEVTYLEIDPDLITLIQKFSSSAVKDSLFNEKVKIVNLDGVYFLKNTPEKFDLILIALPSPSTALINRFYTQEFFQLVKEKLNSEGIFSLYLPYSPSAANKDLESLCASIFKTLKAVFPQIIILPEDEIFFLAAKSTNLITDPALLVRRFNERKISTNFLTPNYLAYRFTNERIPKTWETLSQDKTAKINQLFSPVAYFYQTLFWLDLFSLKFTNFFKKIAFSFWWLCLLVLLSLTIYLIKKRKKQSRIVIAAATAGFSLMSFETIMIFTYQIMVGYLYFKLALLMAFFMLGIAIGAYWGTKKAAVAPTKISLLSTSHKLIGSFSLLLIPTLIFLFSIPFLKLTELFLFLISMLSGLVGGLVFPLANQIYLSENQEATNKTGVIYGADLIGAALGAIISPLILIPVYGVLTNLFLIAFLNIWLIFILRQKLEP